MGSTKVKRQSISRTFIPIILVVSALPLLRVDSALAQTSRATLSPASRDEARRARFAHDSNIDREPGTNGAATAGAATEAPSGYDGLTNGLDPQGPPFDSLNAANVVGLRSYNDNRFVFEEVDTVEEGLGPTYNAQSCRECHQNVATGGASQVAEQRTGHLQGGTFFDSQGGSLIQSRATYPEAMELVAAGDEIRTFRISTNTLGAGYIEAISNSTLLALRDQQPAPLRGTAVSVAVLEANSHARVGRFGWKSQHASLESFAGDAYINEIGITNPLFPDENNSSGRDVSAYDGVPDPEDDGGDLKAFASFMRATKAPPRGTITGAVTAGEKVFAQTGCSACHVASIKTAPPGTKINGGTYTVGTALGNKIIHPYSDFLLHDIGTGDGIPIQPTAEYASTADQIRTAPLWGLRTRNRLMHDGLSFTREDAIGRHAGQGTASEHSYAALSPNDKANLLAFLNSL